MPLQICYKCLLRIQAVKMSTAEIQAVKMSLNFCGGDICNIKAKVKLNRFKTDVVRFCLNINNEGLSSSVDCECDKGQTAEQVIQCSV